MDVKVEIRGSLGDVEELLQGQKAASVLVTLDEELRQRIKYDELTGSELEIWQALRSRLAELCYDMGFGLG